MHRSVATLAAAALFSCPAHSAALAADDWFQGPDGNLGVCTTGGAQWYPAAIPDGSGGAIVVWHDNRNAATTGYDIYAQHILSSGVVDASWPSQGVALTLRSGNDEVPAICSDGSGGAYVVWIGDFGVEFLAQHLLGTGTVDPAWPPDGITVRSGGVEELFTIVADGAGGAYVVMDEGGVVSQRRIFVSHLVASGIDAGWPFGGERACTNEAGQYAPVACSDGNHGVYIAWVDSRNSTRDIYGAHVLIDGSHSWPIVGLPICTAAGSQLLNADGTNATRAVTTTELQSSAIQPDGSGGFLITWSDSRALATSGLDVYVQRITSTGLVTSGWPANGAVATVAAGNQDLPTLLPDGGGGATVLWRDARAGTYVNHISSSGIEDGYVDGMPIDALGTGLPLAVRDASNGAIIYYERYESGELNLYAQHMLNSPNLQIDPAWPSTGLALSTHSGNQWVGTIVSDNAAGAIAIWADARDSVANGYDVYAQRALSSGTLPTGVMAVRDEPHAAVRLGLSPSPVVGDADLRFSVPTRSRVRIDLYDVLGREALGIVDADEDAGDHVMRSIRGPSALHNGVYYLRMIAEPAGGGATSTAASRVVIAR